MKKGRLLDPGTYGFGNIQIGDVLRTGTAQITYDMIDRFAALSGDRYVLHMDKAAAQARGFPDRVAHGLLVLSVVDGLKNNAPARLDGLVSLGWDWQFERPVFAGDSIRGELTIQNKRVTGAGNRGIAQIGFEVWNGSDQRVQSGHNKLMFDLGPA